MSILKKLSQNRVVYFDLNETKTQMNIIEGCDLNFELDLSKSEVKELIDELTKLYITMNDNTTIC